MDALNVRRLVGDTLALIVQSLATLICGFVVAMVANWQLALIITVVIPLVGLQGYAQVKFLQGFSADAKVRPMTFQILLALCMDTDATHLNMGGYINDYFVQLMFLPVKQYLVLVQSLCSTCTTQRP